MNKKTIFVIGMLLVVAALGAFGYFGATSLAKGTDSPAAWFGQWQMGPNFDTTVLGCTAGDGFARITGIYYPTQDRVYFLGARCEDNNTYGNVFYFDPVTESYALTGVTMITPVSNYQVVRIDDDGNASGPGFYIVGGRKNDGSQSSDVQVYYPDFNSTQIISTDPFPPAVPYSPGGVVAVGGKIYVFGGFDGTNMYAGTYVYDPLAPAGTRWTQLPCDLPTARSYISAIALNTKIYAMGGDELPVLTPIANTTVLDVDNLGACWQDNLMADLPQANGDAPAVYVNENYIGGGIFMVGGYWPTPGPYRWVFRYDVANDLWESFPDMAIPAPATGRRDQAAVYIPSTSGGTGPGIPGIWTFGGYDGSATNAMTESSEYFANPAASVLLAPEFYEVTGAPGTTVSDLFTVVNLSGMDDTYDLFFTQNVPWTVTMPVSIGPIPQNGQDTFTMYVDIPADAACGAVGSFTVTATSQTDPGITASATITVRVPNCDVSGTVYDMDSSNPIPNAYVWIQDTPDGLGAYYDAFTDASGNYLIQDVAPGNYLMGADAIYHQPSFYPGGWPGGAIPFTMSNSPVSISPALYASKIDWNPGEFSVTMQPNSVYNGTLTLTNNGSGPYSYNISVLDGSQTPPPQDESIGVPGLPRVDDQILSDIAASPDGTAEFVVVLNSQADVSAAYGIKDWNQRGRAVYQMLNRHADLTQGSLRHYLNSQKVEFTPLYIINGVIVHSGNATLVNDLAARPDVAQLVANRKIAVEQPSTRINELLQLVSVPNTVGWNITKIGADSVWSTYGTKGQGMVVAEIDTGTQFDHPALVNQYRGNEGGGNFDHNYNWYDPYFQCPDAGKTPCDTRGHGTHVMGTMVGDDGVDHQIGVAPGAKWISCKGGDTVSGYLLTDQLLVCAQWILAPFDLNGANPNPDLRPNVVNNSWGGGRNDYWYTGAISAWRAAGIFPAFSNGNSGPGCTTAGSPGDNWESFASGASDINDNLAGFSSRGPSFVTGFLKPQVTAPGVSICSSVPGSGYSCGYSGTSMASPHSAGSIALLWSADPELLGQIDLSAWVLEQTADPLSYQGACGGDYTNGPNNDWGYGRLNIFDAVTMAKQGNLVPSWLAVDPMYGSIGYAQTGLVYLHFSSPAQPGVYTATMILIGDDPYNPDIRIPITMNVEQPVTDLSITKVGSPDPVMVNTTINYTLTVSNNGPADAPSVTVVDTLPEGVTFESASSGCVEAAGVVTCDVGLLESGASVELTIVVTSPAKGGLITNTATVSGEVDDPTPANNVATVDTYVVPFIYLPLIGK